jgi:ornithine cyclodeaminase/alanine dehydrogenase-like protein (mu-crystallin family)
MSETTVFKSVGIAVEDIGAAKLIFDEACQHPR